MLRHNHPIIHTERTNTSGTGGLGGIMAAANADIVAAVAGGDWSSTSTWVGGVVPGAGDNVHIPVGSNVRLTSDETATLGWIRNDGIFRVHPTNTTGLIFHTFLSTNTSYFEIGTPVAPITGACTLQVNAASHLTGDMMEQGAGIILHDCRVMIRGKALGAPFVRLTAGVALNDTVVTVEDSAALTGWAVGDQVVIPTTQGRDNTLSETTVRTISGISGADITLSSGALAHPALADISTPEGETHKNKPHIINETRTVVLKTHASSTLRGHFMVMHNKPSERLVPFTDNKANHRTYPTDLGANAETRTDIRWLQIVGFGRTEALASPAVGSAGNLAGKYAYHYHHLGHWTQDPAVAQGISIQDFKIWAMVHHDSHAHFDWCVARNGQGAGMVCEDDTEIGAWTRNFMMDVKNGSGADEDIFNGHGREGEGYTPNRQIMWKDNIAANCQFGCRLYQNEVSPQVRTGDVNATPSSPRYAAPGRFPDYQGVLRRAVVPTPVAFLKSEDPNLARWDGFECYSCNNGLSVFHRLRNYRAQVFFAQLFNWNFWKVGTAIEIQNYSWNYIFRNFTHQDGTTFFDTGDKVSGMVFVNGHIKDVTNRVSVNAAARNAIGAFVDVTRTNVTNEKGGNLSNTGFDATVHSSAGWTKPDFDLPTTIGGTYNDTLSNNGVPWEASDPTTTLQMGVWAQGTASVNTGIPFIGDGFNQRPQSTDHSMTKTELVEQYGCWSDGGTDKVREFYWMTDRFNGDVHAFINDRNVSSVDSAIRNANRTGSTPPATPTLVMVPSLPADDSLTTYVVKQNSDGVLAVARDGVVTLDAHAIHGDILVGATETVTVSTTVTDDAGSASGNQTFTITGRGVAPANVSAPTITRHGVEITGSMTAPTNTSSGSDRYSVRFDLGEWTGFPEPKLTVRLLVDGSTYTAYDYNEDPYWIARTGRNETIQIGVTAENEHGTTSEVLSNVVTFA